MNVTKHIKMTRVGLHRSLLLALVLFLGLAAHAQRSERTITTWQPTRFDVNVVFDDDLTQLTSATANVSVLIDQDKTDLIDLDLGTMPVSKVEASGQQLKFEQHDQKLDVHLPRRANKGQTL